MSCPVKAIKAWLRAAGITEGALFRPVGRLGEQRLTDKSVCDIVKDYAQRLGLKAADFGAHSLRAGFLTGAARRGASALKMRDVSSHKPTDVLQAYVRDAELGRVCSRHGPTRNLRLCGTACAAEVASGELRRETLHFTQKALAAPRQWEIAPTEQTSTSDATISVNSLR
jgi:hypothetical protein